MKLIKTYLINLDKDNDRLKWMDKQFKGFPYERFPAITPETIPEKIKAIFPKENPVLIPTEQACFASHLALYYKILESPKDPESFWLICEDDLEINQNFLKIIEAIPADLCGDIIRLNDFPKTPTVKIAQVDSFKLIRYGKIPLGTGSYLINQNGAQTIIDCAREIRMPYDSYLRYIGRYTLKTTGIFPPPLIQDVFQTSSISNNFNRLYKRKYSFKNPRKLRNNLHYIFEKLNFNYLKHSVLFALKKEKKDYKGNYILKS
ncbi:MAG: hypothetical protein CML12_03555 [Puniceicoccaceae bacterium]|nr:hypothetical protein [Puniceicoccaceae bacterium]